MRRSSILLPALGVALLAGTSLARAQTVETIVTPAPTIIAQDPLVVTEPAPIVESVPVRTTETVRTERSTTHPTRRIARAPAPAPQRSDTVTTTQTTLRENIAPRPFAPAVAVISPPAYPAPLYDVVPAGAMAPPAVIAQPPMPAYQYVYQPDRILVIDANTGVAVRALPR